VYKVVDEEFDDRDFERQFRRFSVADTAGYQVAAPVRRVVDHRRDYLDLEDYHTVKDQELILRRDRDRDRDGGSSSSRREYDRREFDERREYKEREVYDSRDYDMVQDYLHGDRRPAVEHQELVVRREKDYGDRYYEADVRKSSGSFGRYYDERDREERIYEERVYEAPPRREVEREREIITTVLEARAPTPEPRREIEREIITTVLAPLPQPEPKRYEHYHHHRSHHRSKSRKRSSSKSKEKELKKELKREKKKNKKLRKELEESSSSESEEEEEERTGRTMLIEGEGLTIVRRRHHSRKGEVTETVSKQKDIAFL